MCIRKTEWELILYFLNIKIIFYSKKIIQKCSKGVCGGGAGQERNTFFFLSLSQSYWLTPMKFPFANKAGVE